MRACILLAFTIAIFASLSSASHPLSLAPTPLEQVHVHAHDTFVHAHNAGLVLASDTNKLVHDVPQVVTHSLSSVHDSLHHARAEARLALQRAKQALKSARERFEVLSHHALEHVRESARVALVQAEDQFHQALAHLRALVTSHGSTWHTNTTVPPPGDWLLHVEFDCWDPDCEFRVLKLRDWEVTTQWQVNGTGSYDTPLKVDQESYFFRYQGGEALTSWIPLPPPLHVDKSNLPLAGILAGLLLILIAARCFDPKAVMEEPEVHQPQVEFQWKDELATEYAPNAA